MEILTAGKTSQTDIVLCYMENRVDRKLLRELRGRINTIKLDSLTMNQESLAECIYERNGQSLPEIQVYRTAGRGVCRNSGGQYRGAGR